MAVSCIRLKAMVLKLKNPNMANTRFYYLLLFFLLGSTLPGQDFSDYVFTSFNMSNSPLENNHIRDILFDERGGAYISFNGRGLYHFDGEQWAFLEPPNSIKMVWFNKMLWDKEGWIWIAGSREIVRYHPERGVWDTVPTPSQSFHMDRNSLGVFIYGGGGSQQFGGFLQWTGKNWVPVDSGHQDVMGIYICQNDDAVVSYRDGTWRYPMGEEGLYGMPSEQVSEMAFYDFDEDSQGTLWGASYSELKLHSLTKDEWVTHYGVPARMKYRYREEPTYSAHNVLVLPDDRVIVTTQFKGFLAIWDGVDWEAYGLPIIPEHDGVERIVQHPDGSIWCATWASGLVVFHPQEQTFPMGGRFAPR